jgi:hypothetical protein
MMKRRRNNFTIFDEDGPNPYRALRRERTLDITSPVSGYYTVIGALRLHSHVGKGWR